jgi:hypothetical protein
VGVLELTLIRNAQDSFPGVFLYLAKKPQMPASQNRSHDGMRVLGRQDRFIQPGMI